MSLVCTGAFRCAAALFQCLMFALIGSAHPAVTHPAPRSVMPSSRRCNSLGKWPLIFHTVLAKTVTGEVLVRCTFNGARASNPAAPASGSRGVALSRSYAAGADDVPEHRTPLLRWLQVSYWESTAGDRSSCGIVNRGRSTRDTIITLHGGFVCVTKLICFFLSLCRVRCS